MLGPGAIYPRHSHAAEEIYQVIAGEVDIDTGDMGWRRYTRDDLPPYPVGAPCAALRSFTSDVDGHLEGRQIYQIKN